MVCKHYKGRQLKPGDKEWNKGKWVVEFMLKGNRVLRAVPHARNKKEAEEEQRKIQSQIDGGIYCSTPVFFSEFVDNVSRNGVSSATIKRGFEIACTRAEITYGLTCVGGLTWHGLRHSFATRLREQGVHPFDIKELMGHKTLFSHGEPCAWYARSDATSGESIAGDLPKSDRVSGGGVK